MKCFVNNREVLNSRIGPPAMNFGQNWRYAGCEMAHYRLVMAVEEFRRKVAEPFDQFRREVNDDMAKHGEDWSEPPFVEFRQLQFPSLTDLIDHHAELLPPLMLWLNSDLLNWLDDGETEVDPFYSINSVEAFSIHEGTVELAGIAYGRKSA